MGLNDVLKELGINIGVTVAGFFGSLLMVGNRSAKHIQRTWVAILAGVSSANYLTPLASDMLKVENHQYRYSIAFLLGFLGLRGIEVISEKFLKDKTKDGNN